jgi:pyrroloquinoline quinone biosynthesis protein D
MKAPGSQDCPALAPAVRLGRDPVSGEAVLLYPEGVLVLNETAHAIVSRCDGATPVKKILDAVASEYEVSPEEIAADAFACLGDLKDRQLITVPAP